MAEVSVAVELLKRFVNNNHLHCGPMLGAIEEVISLLSDPTTLFIVWNEQDFQEAARKKLAYIEGCDEDQIIDEPLTKEQIALLVTMLEDRYDANNGITYTEIDDALGHISLPASDCCFKLTGLAFQIQEAESGLEMLRESLSYDIFDLKRFEQIRKTLEDMKQMLKENQHA